jgi:hypothetical protein
MSGVSRMSVQEGIAYRLGFNAGLSAMRESIKELLLENSWLRERILGAADLPRALPKRTAPARSREEPAEWLAQPAMTCRLASATRRVPTNGWRDLRVSAALAGALLLGFAGVVHAGPELPDRVLAQVPADRRAEVEEILAAPTFERSLHLETVADLPVLVYLLDHPDVNASMARALGIAPYRAVRIGPGHYKGDDGGGNTGTIDIFGTEGPQRVVVERGVSPGWWFGDISGRVVVLVAFAAADGERVRSEVTVWARIDQGVVAAMLHLLTPILGGFLDGKIREQFGLTIRVAEAASRDTARFCKLLAGISDRSLEQHQTLAGMAACPGEMGPTNLRVAAPDGRLLGATGLDSSVR